MKSKTFFSLTVSLALLLFVSLPELSLGQNGSSSISTPVPETRAELAEPPLGKIRKIHFRTLKGFDSEIQKRIDKSSKTKNDVKFAADLRSLRAKVQKATASLNKEDLFDVVPEMVAIYEAKSQEVTPEDDDGFTHVQRAKHTVESLNEALLKSMAEYIREKNGTLTNEMASKFATVFLTKGFVLAPEWEEEEIPVGGADIFVANSSAVVERLKASPWQCVQQFIGGDNMTSTQFFARYEPNGDGMPVLKTKYLANKAEISAKFDEVKNWVIQQEQQAQSKK